MKIEYICMSRCGRRSRQEDTFVVNGVTSSVTDLPVDISGTCRLDGPRAFWVFDGVGGEAGGDIAASLAAEIAANKLPPQQGTLEYLLDVFRTAHKEILNNTARHPMGTTAAALVLTEGAVYVANIGDSRVYCRTSFGLTQITVDDSVLLESRRFLTQNLGMPKPFSEIKPHIFTCSSTAGLHEFLLCSDGLSENLAESELCALMENTAQPLEEKGALLMERALSGDVADNVTLILVRLLPE